jgi:hypothetical protein
MAKPLGRRPPTDWEHVEKFPLTLATLPTPPVPVVFGINWYSNFDNPVKGSDGRFWIGRSTNLGTIRGGHAICAKPEGIADLDGWWDFYDQGSEGACVGFSESRCMSLLNRARYAAQWLYYEAQKIDSWPGGGYPGADPFYEGTECRAGFETLRLRGHRRVYSGKTYPVDPANGISTYRWGTLSDVLAALRNPAITRHYDQIGGIPLLNSWGRSYPHRVWIPLAVVDRLLHEDGEAGVVTDK